MKEIYKDVRGYGGFYKVSNLGNVKSIRFNRILKPATQRDGYLVVNLSVYSIQKTSYIHHLMAGAFLDHTINRIVVVDHIDNDKSNNKLNNLQIISQRKNAWKDIKGCASKYIGVSSNRSNTRWVAKIWVDGASKHLGTFNNELDAHEAYKTKLNEIDNRTKSEII